MPKTIWIESFRDFEDAVMWMEHSIYDLGPDRASDGTRVELVLIDGVWRVGIETNSRQGEFNFNTENTTNG